MTLFGMWIAGYWPVSDFWLVLKAWLGVLAEFLGGFYADHVRFDLRHPYRASTDTLIQGNTLGAYEYCPLGVPSCDTLTPLVYSLYTF